MSENKKSGIAYFFFFLLFAAAFIFAAINDLAITKFLYDKNAVWAEALDLLGEPPAIFAAMFCIGVIYRERDRAREKIIYNIANLGGAFYVVNKVAKTVFDGKKFTVWEYALQFVIGIVIAELFLYFTGKISREQRRKIFYGCVTVLIVAVATLVITNLFKLTWGRMRPFNMDENFSEFSPVWKLDLFNIHNRSFPSGHTANATVMYSLTVFTDKCGGFRKYIARFLFLAYILLLAFSRVVYGAHFATDVLAGFAITMAIFLITRKYMNKYLENKGIDQRL